MEECRTVDSGTRDEVERSLLGEALRAGCVRCARAVMVAMRFGKGLLEGGMPYGGFVGSRVGLS